MKLAVPDLISPSYFPAIAAVELGCIAERGVEIDLELRYPVTDAVEALRAGEIDVLAGAAHSLFHNAPDGAGVRLLAALARNTYWFLVVRKDLGLARGDLGALRGLTIGAAPGPVDALIQLLIDSAVDPESVNIGPVPGTVGNTSFGVTAAQALASGQLDGFWANGMGAEVAVRNGTGAVLVDARRDSAPAQLAHYTFAGVMAMQGQVGEQPGRFAAVVAGITDAQERLRANPGLATSVGEALYPAMEAGLIAELVARDAPFYKPAIEAPDLSALVSFSRQRGLTTLELGADDLVAPGLGEV